MRVVLALLCLTACSTERVWVPSHPIEIDPRNTYDGGSNRDGDDNTAGPDGGETQAGDPQAGDDQAQGDPQAGDDPVGDSQPTVQRFVLGNAEDVVLAAFLSAQSANPALPVLVVVPTSTIVGATSVGDAALESGDLTSYTEVTLEVAGEIHGAAGPADSGVGGNAIVVSTPLRLHVTITGAVRGGGGGGGRGGTGGNGDIADSWTGYQYSTDQPKYFWSPSWGYITWNGTTDIAAGQMGGTYAFDGGKVYQKGTQRTDAPLPILFEVRRADLLAGTRGAGGSGGHGRGYQSDAGLGAAGGSGTRRAGGGGSGGDGGDWGEAGANGANGTNGAYYSANSASASSSGSNGIVAGNAGAAIAGVGVTVPYLAEGTVEGAITVTTTDF